MALAEKIELTRRGFLVKGGAGVAGAAALSGMAPLSAMAAPAEQMSVANTLRLRFGGQPENIDPQKSSFIDEIEVIMRVYRNLLQFDNAGNVVPDQAEALPELGEGGTLYTFRLRPGLTYSDGTPLHAQHFVDAWKRHLDPRTEGQYAFLGYIIAGGEQLNQANARTTTADDLENLRNALGVWALDDRTLQIKTIAPAPWFLAVLTTWCGVPTRTDTIVAGNGGDLFGSRWTSPATYIGNGPYKMVGHEQDVSYTFEANDLFYRGAPPIRYVTHTIIREASVAFAAYLNGELDTVTFLAEDKPRVDADPNLQRQFYQYADPLTIWWAFSSTKPPFNDQKVRAAFAAGFDRVGFVRNIEGGQGIPARQLVPPGFHGNFEFELEEQTYNPDVARRLLAEAGYPGGRGLPQVTLQHASTAATRRRAEGFAEVIRLSLGVTIALEPVEPTTLVARRKSVEQYPQITRAGWHQDYNDAQNWYSTVFNSKNPVDKTGWKNAEFDRLSDAADIDPDPARRLELYRQAGQIFINDAPVILSHYQVIWRLVSPRVANFKPDPLAFFFGERILYDMRLA